MATLNFSHLWQDSMATHVCAFGDTWHKCNEPGTCLTNSTHASMKRACLQSYPVMTTLPLSLFIRDLLQKVAAASPPTWCALTIVPKITSDMRSVTHFSEQVWRSLSWPKRAILSTCAMGSAASMSTSTSDVSSSNFVSFIFDQVFALWDNKSV